MTDLQIHWRNPGVAAALAAALLFGLGTPLAKLLLSETSPWMLASLLYLGSGLGLLLLRAVRGARHVEFRMSGAGWLIAAIAAGGIAAPVLLMWGLVSMPASGASLLLNAEGVFTALIAWFVFRENFDRRIAAGMALIVAGAVVLAWPDQVSFDALAPAAAVVAACLAWAIDNNLTRKVSLSDATFIAMIKGLAAGLVNLVLAFAAGTHFPGLGVTLLAGLVGFLSYGVSLTLFVVALRNLGTARTGAYFSTAPFAGAAFGVIVLGEPVSAGLLAAGALMAAGVWLHLSERHEHEHVHEPLDHEHEHVHDVHHQHAHSYPVPPGTRHTHPHRHEPLVHAHPHFPDAHHRHDH